MDGSSEMVVRPCSHHACARRSPPGCRMRTMSCGPSSCPARPRRGPPAPPPRSPLPPPCLPRSPRLPHLPRLLLCPPRPPQVRATLGRALRWAQGSPPGQGRQEGGWDGERGDEVGPLPGSLTDPHTLCRVPLFPVPAAPFGIPCSAPTHYGCPRGVALCWVPPLVLLTPLLSPAAGSTEGSGGSER